MKLCEEVGFVLVSRGAINRSKPPIDFTRRPAKLDRNRETANGAARN
jgi:hypothetical protein